ncbi:LLM class flavin-dependent oxidoreductase [Peribacillus huizhouensis]|uniref:Luciferase family oxidoreductase group 1 n=1 Tax=Peribacillus huizhouensis TaxID=1501239 RepID=A0ABR6CK78_9BACI|nr:LLM class flavin-dependent oxidoreductase [Peribacillus huizhouensis]MBA9025116.1 luciferase family oxidoreductase group 1 [Peribacillus huizhouensis]
MNVKLSILDQSPIEDGGAEIALRDTVKLAQKAEQLGYYRFWVSEHHNSDLVAGSAPEVLVSYLLARTNTIRIGSGGVMLQHYSPYKVAETFNVLAALAPGRVDLGVGKGPGGLPNSTEALQQGDSTLSFEEKLQGLNRFISNELREENERTELRAVPAVKRPADLFLLGASGASAQLAAESKLSYVFAHFFNSGDSLLIDAITEYRTHWNGDFPPTFILALSVVVAETDEVAQSLIKSMEVVKIHFANGKSLTFTSREHAEQFVQQSKEECTISVQEANILYGSKETIRKKLFDIQETYNPDEIMIVTPVANFEKRLESIVLLKEAFSDITVQN